MKSVKLFIVLLAVVFASILCISNDVFAKAEFSFDVIKMVDDNGSFTGQSEFGFNETPWLYMRLPENSGPGQDFSLTFSYWNDPQSTKYNVDYF